MENNNVINQEEAVEVAERTVEAPQQTVRPLQIQVVFHRGAPLNFTVGDMQEGQFQQWVSQTIANQLNNVGIFIGEVFIPNANIKFYQEIH